MSRNISKRVSEIASWDLDASCRKIINQGSSSNRRLKKIIRRQDKKRLDNWFKKCYNESESEV